MPPDDDPKPSAPQAPGPDPALAEQLQRMYHQAEADRQHRKIMSPSETVPEGLTTLIGLGIGQFRRRRENVVYMHFRPFSKLYVAIVLVVMGLVGAVPLAFLIDGLLSFRSSASLVSTVFFTVLNMLVGVPLIYLLLAVRLPVALLGDLLLTPLRRRDIVFGALAPAFGTSLLWILSQSAILTIALVALALLSGPGAGKSQNLFLALGCVSVAIWIFLLALILLFRMAAAWIKCIKRPWLSLLLGPLGLVIDLVFILLLMWALFSVCPPMPTSYGPFLFLWAIIVVFTYILSQRDLKLFARNAITGYYRDVDAE